ncbi:MAG TPA: PilZ domain-containing protein [Candidatus Acidoferrales bacterium]|jgi:hypothetical protein|nr:PilZ domain-containing protein [Candidatus Acidoferrales bacterium]
MSKHTEMQVVASLPGTAPSPDRAPPERRGGQRYPFSAGVEICEARSKARVTGRCSDLGSGGCYVDTPSPLAVGAEVNIRINHDDREFEAAAIVAYAHVQMGMGIAFTKIKPEHQKVLRSWIGGLSGDPSGDEAASVEPAPAKPAPVTVEREGEANLRFVLNELITLLVRRKIITESEAAGLLRQLFR